MVRESVLEDFRIYNTFRLLMKWRLTLPSTSFIALFVRLLITSQVSYRFLLVAHKRVSLFLVFGGSFQTALFLLIISKLDFVAISIHPSSLGTLRFLLLFRRINFLDNRIRVYGRVLLLDTTDSASEA